MPARQTRPTAPVTRFSSLESYLAHGLQTQGTIEIHHGGIPLHLHYESNDSDATFVAFAGSVPAKVVHIPAWAGDGISRHLNVNRLLISDPSIYLSTELQLGWYGGNLYQPNLQQDLTQIIRALTAGRRTILFGPSGGGFAALYQAAHIDNALALVSNPQTSVIRYTKEPVDKYLRIAWDITDTPTEDMFPFSQDVTDIYRLPNTASILYMQNTGDRHHMRRHYRRFREINHAHNQIEYLLPNFGRGHIGSDKGTFRTLLELIRDNPEWHSLIGRVRATPLTRNL